MVSSFILIIIAFFTLKIKFALQFRKKWYNVEKKGELK